jgi:hypothetical protein
MKKLLVFSLLLCLVLDYTVRMRLKSQGSPTKKVEMLKVGKKAKFIKRFT